MIRPIHIVSFTMPAPHDRVDPVAPTARRLRSCAFGLFVLGLLCAEAAAQGYLRVSGRDIVNDNGPVLLRGIGIGGWLVPEGYMLETSSFANAAWQFRQKVEELVGTANADQFFAAYRSHFVQEEDVRAIAGWGFNSIRLPMHYALLTPKDQPGVYLESGFALIDSLLAWCERNSIYLILDLHAAPGGQNDDNISDYNPAEPSLWASVLNQDRTVDLWRTIALRYRTRTWIGGYDLLNEPAKNLGPGNVPLRNLYERITAAIREVDTTHVIFVEGNWYATDFSGLTPPWDSKMVYSFHKYWNPNDQGSIAGYLGLRSQYNVPLWLGESGENSNTWFTDAIVLMESNNIGWSWWTLKKVASISGLMSVRRNGEYAELLRYWNNQAPRPSVAYAVNALNILAENFAFARTKVNIDVIDAMFRQTMSAEPVPFTRNDIPGTIYAVNYDLGRRNVAWADADYQNVGGPSSTWNSGWQFRNDGVDIEECTDFPTNGYSIGWTASGDYLTYTVEVAQAGSYGVTVRIAAGATGGRIQLRWNGNPVTGFIEVPQTGGWSDWQTLSLGTLDLPAGTHRLAAFFYFGGFNVNAFEFTRIGTTVDRVPGPMTFGLAQNFPNPFNPRTTIPFTIDRHGHVSLAVFNVLGERIATLVDRDMAPGEHVATFEVTGLPTGLYVFRLRQGGRQVVRTMTVLR